MIRKTFWLTFAAMFLLASAAEAQQKLSLTGKYGRRNGALVGVPQKGITTCFAHLVGLGVGVLQGTMTQATPIPLQVPNNLGGCIPGSSATNPPTSTLGAMVMGSGPASFTVPTSAFGQPTPVPRNVTPVPVVPFIIQFGTQASAHGPLATPMAPINSTAGAPKAVWKQFKQNAWMTQTGRPGLAFTACWGAAPAVGAPPGNIGQCNNINQGTRPMLAKYKNPAGNAFGGTMSLILNSTVASPITVAFINTPQIGPGQVRIQNITGSGSAGIPGGRGYRGTIVAGTATNMVYASFGTTTAPTVGGGSAPVISFLGPLVNTLAPGAPGTFVGLPFTTGTVLARNTGTQGGNPQTVTLTARGTDLRTPKGRGNITLVASGLGASQTNSATIDQVSLSFVPEPGVGLLLFAGGLGLVGLGRLRARRS